MSKLKCQFNIKCSNAKFLSFGICHLEFLDYFSIFIIANAFYIDKSKISYILKKQQGC